jgi:hypothetical protein
MSDLHYFLPSWIENSNEHMVVDVCVYGGTSAGLIAAVEAIRRNKKVVILHPGKFLGGLTTGGLGFTDYGRKAVIGGLSREFYRKIGQHYGREEEFQFIPSIATAVYGQFIRQYDLPVRFCQYIESATTIGNRISEVKMRGGMRVVAKMFIDATYEGDLLARAGVTYTVGRESNDIYGETLNGIQVRDKHQFSHRVDPYVRQGEPSSGLLPYVLADDLTKKQGQGDKRVQAYNFRMCMTDDPALKIEWPRPRDYNPLLYELAGRWFRSEKDQYNEQVWPTHPTTPEKFDILPDKTPGGFHKTDTNNHGPISSDFIGANHDWPDASYETRERIFQAHVSYQQGLYWYMANSPDVPDRYRAAYGRWGLPKDEFTQTENWPCQLYIREARRMVSDYVITEHVCRGERKCDDSVGMGSYGIDSHNCSRFVHIDAEGKPWVLNDGDVQVPARPYSISYKAIVPRRGECENLVVPVCLSSSHIAYGSARMEPVFMVLGESAAAAACHAIDDNVSVQDVSYAKLQKDLLDQKQVLVAPE